MPIEILMPALSPTMTHGNLTKWKKAEGDTVKAGDVLCDIETDKATIEVPTSLEGVVGNVAVKAGDKPPYDMAFIEESSKKRKRPDKAPPA